MEAPRDFLMVTIFKPLALTTRKGRSIVRRIGAAVAFESEPATKVFAGLVVVRSAVEGS